MTIMENGDVGMDIDLDATHTELREQVLAGISSDRDNIAISVARTSPADLEGGWAGNGRKSVGGGMHSRHGQSSPRQNHQISTTQLDRYPSAVISRHRPYVSLFQSSARIGLWSVLFFALAYISRNYAEGSLMVAWLPTAALAAAILRTDSAMRYIHPLVYMPVVLGAMALEIPVIPALIIASGSAINGTLMAVVMRWLIPHTCQRLETVRGTLIFWMLAGLTSVLESCTHAQALTNLTEYDGISFSELVFRTFPAILLGSLIMCPFLTLLDKRRVMNVIMCWQNGYIIAGLYVLCSFAIVIGVPFAIANVSDGTHEAVFYYMFPPAVVIASTTGLTGLCVFTAVATVCAISPTYAKVDALQIDNSVPTAGDPVDPAVAFPQLLQRIQYWVCLLHSAMILYSAAGVERDASEASLRRKAREQGRKNRADDTLKKPGAQLAASESSMVLGFLCNELLRPLRDVLKEMETLLSSDPLVTQRQTGKAEIPNPPDGFFASLSHSTSSVHHLAQSMLHLVSDGYDFSRLANGLITVRPVFVDLPWLLESVVNGVARAQINRKVPIDVRLAPDLPRMVQLDEECLRRVLHSLFVDACKYVSQHSSVIFEVTLPNRYSHESSHPHQSHHHVSNAASQTDTVDIDMSITVTDWVLEHPQADALLRPYAHTTSTGSSVASADLSLAVASGFARCVGGRVVVFGQSGRGTVFSFKIPVKVERGTAHGHGRDRTGGHGFSMVAPPIGTLTLARIHQQEQLQREQELEQHHQQEDHFPMGRPDNQPSFAASMSGFPNGSDHVAGESLQMQQISHDCISSPGGSARPPLLRQFTDAAGNVAETLLSPAKDLNRRRLSIASLRRRSKDYQALPGESPAVSLPRVTRQLDARSTSGMDTAPISNIAEVTPPATESETNTQDVDEFVVSAPIPTKAHIENPEPQYPLSFKPDIPEVTHAVLIVDDSSISRAILLRMLTKYPHISRHEATDGSQALEMCLAQRFDLVLMDMQMPQMTGMDTATRLRREGCTFPIVLTTANNVIRHEALYQAGINDMVLKPVTKDMLAHILTTYGLIESTGPAPDMIVYDSDAPAISSSMRRGGGSLGSSASGPFSNYGVSPPPSDGFPRHKSPPHMTDSYVTARESAGSPRMTPSSNLQRGGGTSDNSTTPSGTSRRPMRHVMANESPILVVDDNPISRAVLRKTLMRILPGRDIVEAADGSDAIALCATGQRFALIYMDLEMANMDGDIAASRIRSMRAASDIGPLIAVTGHRLDTESLATLRKAGFNEAITKPVTREMLTETLWKYGIMKPISPGHGKHELDGTDYFNIAAGEAPPKWMRSPTGQRRLPGGPVLSVAQDRSSPVSAINDLSSTLRSYKKQRDGRSSATGSLSRNSGGGGSRNGGGNGNSDAGGSNRSSSGRSSRVPSRVGSPEDFPAMRNMSDAGQIFSSAATGSVHSQHLEYNPQSLAYHLQQQLQRQLSRDEGYSETHATDSSAPVAPRAPPVIPSAPPAARSPLPSTNPPSTRATDLRRTLLRGSSPACVPSPGPGSSVPQHHLSTIIQQTRHQSSPDFGVTHVFGMVSKSPKPS
ncbi:hypothetical protein DFS34DRAFT_650775 [Phlyctochytrium arcticum]|nr:hypothetical protein DFS34DRAFT_650775 [Phlyctochytrium arcticum]